MAMFCLKSDNWNKIIKAYSILDKMHTYLPAIGPDPDLMYAHAMYYFSKAECFRYFNNWEQSMYQMYQVVRICQLSRILLFNKKQKSVLLLSNLHLRCGDRMRSYIGELGRVRHHKSCKCALCGNRYADKTGSHLVPLLLIKKIFPRFKELAIEGNNAMAHYFGYVGRNLAYDIDNIRGYELSDEERELEALMSNPLTRDNLFCTKCEHRFTVIENEMVKVHRLQELGKVYEYKIPYLFWLSIFYRMSVGKMSITLASDVENQIRHILLNGIDDNGSFCLDNVDTCFYYGASQCKDIRNEPPGIMGTRGFNEPYTIIIGNLVMTLFANKTNANNFRKIDPYMHFNNGTNREVWDDLPFKIYWDRMQYVIFENAEYDLMHLGVSDVTDVSLPSTDNTYWSKNDIMIDVGDYHFLKGKYPLIIPKALNEVIKRKLINNTVTYTELSKDSNYSEEELEFMMSQWLFREERLTQNLHKYNENNPPNEEDNYLPELIPYGSHETLITLRPNTCFV